MYEKLHTVAMKIFLFFTSTFTLFIAVTCSHYYEDWIVLFDFIGLVFLVLFTQALALLHRLLDDGKARACKTSVESVLQQFN